MSSVRAIAQTTDGYLWLATGEGLARFDGVRFTVFDSRNTPEIKINQMISLYADTAGNLWIGTNGGGLLRYRAEKFQSYTTENGLPENVVLCITGSNQDVWIGTTGKGVARLRSGKFEYYDTKNGLAGNRVDSLFLDHKGNLWMGTDSGLTVLRNGKLSSYTTVDGLSDNHITSFTEDHSGSLWIGTRGGLNAFRDNKFSQHKEEGEIDCLFSDRQGNVWIGTGKGLKRLFNNALDSYSVANGLSHNTVISLYEDREGDLWIGTRGGGLNRMKDALFTSFSAQEGLSDDFTWSVFEDSKRNMWIGTEAYGLNLLNNGSVHTFTTADGLSHNTVYALAEDHEGALWIGTLGGGLNRMKDGRIISYSTADGLSNPFVRSLYVDRNNDLWIGTQNGLNLLRNGKITQWKGLSHYYVISIAEDAQGAMWIGTLGGGLNKIQNEKVTVYTTKDGLSNDVVSCIYLDAQGYLWIGTRSGLNRFRSGKFDVFTARNGLFNDTVFQIVEDAGGRLWMSTINGVFNVSKADLDAFANGRISTIPSVFYSNTDGMKSSECNAGKPSVWKSHDGRLWFATMKGVAVVDPAKMKRNDIQPPVVIEEVIVDGSNLQVEQDAPPGSEKLEFHYTALSFLAPRKVQFQYMLEGYDRVWVEAGNRRTAYYTHIPPGHYRFKVIASNNDGIWNRQGAVFPLYIRPQFYQTTWFYALCTLVVVLTAAGFYQLRLRQMKREFAAILAERTRIARDFHDTVAQSLSGVVAQLDAADAVFEHQPDKSKSFFLRARDLAADSLTEARRALWRLRNESLESGGITGALAELIAKTDSNVKMDLKTAGTPYPLKADVEENLLRIGQEAMNNAIKHSNATCIQVLLSFDSRNVRLVVKDDGSGFDTNSDSSLGHYGLQGIRERVQRLGGVLEVSSPPGIGTTVSVSIPIKK